MCCAGWRTDSVVGGSPRSLFEARLRFDHGAGDGRVRSSKSKPTVSRSHGFRPGRGRVTALREVADT